MRPDRHAQSTATKQLNRTAKMGPADGRVALEGGSAFNRCAGLSAQDPLKWSPHSV